MNLTLGSGDEENGRPLLGGLGAAPDGGGATGARGAAGLIILPPVIVRLASIISSGGGGGTGGGVSSPGCVWRDAILPNGKRAGEVAVGDSIPVLADGGDGWTETPVHAVETSPQPCVKLISESGIPLTCSLSTPITTRDGGGLRAISITDCLGALVPVLDAGGFRWEAIDCVDFIGERDVMLIDCRGATFAAGDETGRYIFTHNKLVTPGE